MLNIRGLRWRGRQRQRQKVIGLARHQLFTCIRLFIHFFVHSLYISVVEWLRYEAAEPLPNPPSFKLRYSAWEFNSKITNIWQTERHGIITMNSVNSFFRRRFCHRLLRRRRCLSYLMSVQSEHTNLCNDTSPEDTWAGGSCAWQLQSFSHSLTSGDAVSLPLPVRKPLSLSSPDSIPSSSKLKARALDSINIWRIWRRAVRNLLDVLTPETRKTAC